MPELRAIRLSETDDFLHVMCDVFGLSVERTRGSFYGDPFFDIERKFAVFVGGKIVSVLTMVPLMFGDGPAAGLCGVGTLADYRGKGYASLLLETVTSKQRCLLFAERDDLYTKCGFRHLDDVVQIPLESDPVCVPSDAPFGLVHRMYSEWACMDDRRLRRDEGRWLAWRLNGGRTVSVGGGYGRIVHGQVREVLPTYAPLPGIGESPWYGLAKVADSIGISGKGEIQARLMGFGFDYPPQMFLTDQF